MMSFTNDRNMHDGSVSPSNMAHAGAAGGINTIDGSNQNMQNNNLLDCSTLSTHSFNEMTMMQNPSTVVSERNLQAQGASQGDSKQQPAGTNASKARRRNNSDKAQSRIINGLVQQAQNISSQAADVGNGANLSMLHHGVFNSPSNYNSNANARVQEEQQHISQQ